MKSYFQSVFNILVSIINYFFKEDTSEQKRTAYEKLINAVARDRIDFMVNHSRIYGKSCKDLTEQPAIQQKEQVIRNAPRIPDIKKQFQIWSENMREYDSIRTRLLDSV